MPHHVNFASSPHRLKAITIYATTRMGASWNSEDRTTPGIISDVLHLDAITTLTYGGRPSENRHRQDCKATMMVTTMDDELKATTAEVNSKTMMIDNIEIRVPLMPVEIDSEDADPAVTHLTQATLRPHHRHPYCHLAHPDNYMVIDHRSY